MSILPAFDNTALSELGDGAVLPGAETIAFSTDSFVVDPLFFPGGDIGKLSVCGTVNDIAMCGGVPRYLSCAFILEEGFPLKELERINNMNARVESAVTATVSNVEENLQNPQERYKICTFFIYLWNKRHRCVR